MNLIDRIQSELQPRPVSSDEALYQYQDSQSGHSLVEIYLPFDSSRRGHWSDRGDILDFREAVGGGDLLDFGPGDGWPSLPVARMARTVTGVDASDRRVGVCNANAERLGLRNYRCVPYQPGEPLPFPDATFDGVMAAHSVEQTPDPRAVIREFERVLRPGGRVRLAAESLERYRGGKEQELDLWAIDAQRTHCTVFDRRPDEERADHYVLILDAPLETVKAAAGTEPEPGLLDRIRPWVRDAMTYSLRHPSTDTWQRWFREAGFREVACTFSGGELARRLFQELDPAGRPVAMDDVEAYLRPIVRAVIGMQGVPRLDPYITATK